jgi:hypothetical protein
MHSPNTIQHVPVANIKEFIQNARFSLASLGCDANTYNIFQKYNFAPSNDSGHLSIAECIWFYLLIELASLKQSASTILTMKMLIFGKIMDEITEFKEGQTLVIDNTAYAKAPILIDELVYSILTKNQDILFNLLSSGAIELVAPVGDPVSQKAKEEQVIATFSVHKILLSIPRLQGIPPLNSTHAVLSHAETQVLQSLRQLDRGNIHIVKERPTMQIATTEYGNVSKAEANSMLYNLPESDELNVKAVRGNRVSYDRIYKKSIKL